MKSTGWMFIAAGVVLVVVGAVILASRHLNLGNLPGDIQWKGEKTTIVFPVVTCIVISVVMTIILNVIARFFRG